jgi:UPF0716 protein FxsA
MRALAIFVGYVVLEFAVAFWIASLVGWLIVIGLTIAGFALGLLVMTNAGTQAATTLREASATGQAPQGAMGDSAVMFGAGVLIAIPGFITDAIGLLLIVPPIRRLAKRLGVFGFARWARRQNMSVVTTTYEGTTVTKVVPGDVVVGDVIRREDESDPKGPPSQDGDHPEIGPSQR